MSDVLTELRQLIAELSLISHAPIQGYEFAPSEFKRPYSWRRSDRNLPPAHTSSHRPKDGDTRAPRGSDVEHRPRAPKTPLIEGDAGSEKAWGVYEEDLAAWRACYHRRTPEYFRRQLERCETAGRLQALRDEATETLAAWRQTPLIAGMRPAMADPRWKQWVADCDHSVAELVSWYGCSRQHIYNVRRAYREAA